MNFGVVIDPGHGGLDSGAVGNDIVEKDMTLDISKIMYDEFKRLGIPVYMTREEDMTLSPKDRVVKAMNFFGKDKNVILISNHINAGGGEGAEVIYSLRNDSKLSNEILDNLSSSGAKIRKSYQKSLSTNPNKDYYFILRDTNPLESIIVEYGFLDNTNDAIRLKNNYQDYALDVVEAVLDYKGIQVGDEYVVKPGDTLYGIAKKYNTNVKTLMDINGLTSTNLSVNQVLKISGDFYTVKPGDTLYGIAKKFNTSVNKIKDMNNLSSDLLTAGQKLKIPNQVIHKVKVGDTLYSIAKTYNVSVDDIKKINKLTNNLISVNQELLIR